LITDLPLAAISSIETVGSTLYTVYFYGSGSGQHLRYIKSHNNGNNWWNDCEIYYAKTAQNGEYLIGYSTSMDGSNLLAAYSLSDFLHPFKEGIFTSWKGKVSENSYANFDIDGSYVVWDQKDANNYYQLFSDKYGQITEYSSNSTMPTTAKSDDIIHIVWVDDRDGINELYYKQRLPSPDFSVTSKAIKVVPQSPVENGTSFLIRARLTNSGSAAQNVEVKFYNGNPDTDGDLIPDIDAEVIRNKTVDIGKKSFATVSIIWTPPIRDIYNVYVWINPEKTIHEEIHTNNLARATESIILYDWIDKFNNENRVLSIKNVRIIGDEVFLKVDENATEWEYEYLADIEPDQDGWALKENAATDLANASGGFLSLNTSSENAYWWYNYNWNASNSVGVTLEARMKVKDIGPNSGLMLGVRDSSRYEVIRIYENKIRGLYNPSLVYNLNTTDDFHIYRLTAQNNDIMVYIDNELCIDGTNKFLGSTSSNVAQFGDTADSSGYYGSSIWDYVRYNISGPISPKYYPNGTITSVNITLPSGHKWSQLLINKIQHLDTYLNVTILDGLSGNPIPGFTNLSESVIDISSINHSTYSSIRLVGRFVGTAFNTPSMDYWAINYTPIHIYPSPTNFIARLSPGNLSNIQLFWNASSDDGGGNNNVMGYTVYKSSTGVNGNYEFAVWIPADSSQTYNWTDFGAGDWDWNNYYYIVRANDTLNNEEQNTVKVGKFVNSLVSGWNMVSVPLIHENNSLIHVIQTIEGNCSAVKGYHAGKSRPWLNWHKDKPDYMNDIMEIYLKSGYYIYGVNPDYLVVAGKVPTTTSVQLKTGWNLVGYPSLIPRTRDDALASIAGQYNKVEFYNTTSNREEPLGPNDLMYPGYGYWIHAISDCTWEVTI
jgi:hypothetical protein